jgi:hypothetical protein
LKYIHFVRAFVFAVTVALALGATMHGALADQVRIYVDFNGGPEPMSGRPIGILVDSAKWTTTKTDIPASWNRVSNISSDSIGSQTGGAGAGKVTLAPATQSKLTSNGLDITVNAPPDQKAILDGAKLGKEIPLVRVNSYAVDAKGEMSPVYSAALTGVLVTSVDWNGRDGDVPTQNISLKYASATIDQYTTPKIVQKPMPPPNPTPKQTATPLPSVIPGGWNRVTNKDTDLTTIPSP